MGRPISQALNELKGFKERADYMLSIADEKLKNIYLPEKENFKNYIKRIPMGVSFIIAPWNYPYLTSVNSIIPSLAAGNSVILKHSAQTPLCAEQLYESAKKTLPNNTFNYLHLNHNDSLKIVSDKRIGFVSFTGSVSAGYEVQKSTMNKFISIALELGGKDPAYVRHDADLENTVENLVDGSFFNSGQSCCGIERIYVDKKIYNNYQGFLFGGASMGNSASINFSIGNNLELKVVDENDSISGTRKIKIFDNLDFSSNYNFLADSFKLNTAVSASSATGIVTYFNLDGYVRSPYIRENDLLGIGDECVKVINVDSDLSRVRVIREYDSTTGSAHTANSLISQNPRSFFFSAQTKLENADLKLNRELYFNPSESIGLGTISGVGIGSTLSFSNPGTGISEIFIPTKALYFKDHGLLTGDALTYNTNAGAAVSVSTDGIDGFALTQGQTVYACLLYTSPSPRDS